MLSHRRSTTVSSETYPLYAFVFTYSPLNWLAEQWERVYYDNYLITTRITSSCRRAKICLVELRKGPRVTSSREKFLNNFLSDVLLMRCFQEKLFYCRLHLEKLERERARQHHVDELRDKGTKMRTLEARFVWHEWHLLVDYIAKMINEVRCNTCDNNMIKINFRFTRKNMLRHDFMSTSVKCVEPLTLFLHVTCSYM